MIIDLTKLFNSNLYKIDVNGKIDVDTSLFKNTDIIRMSTLDVSGFISYDEELLMLNINVKGDMTLPCSRTLKEVKVPINIDIEEEIDENNEKVEDPNFIVKIDNLVVSKGKKVIIKVEKM